MVNQLVVIGRLVAKPETVESENGKKYNKFTLAVPRSYKNENGEYDTDFVDCVSFGHVSDAMSEYCQKGDLIGVKGRIQTSNYEVDGQKKKSMDAVVEKVSFLSSAKDKEYQDTLEV